MAMKNIFLLFLILFYLSSTAQEPPYLQKCVAFIGVKDKKGKLYQIGTGFFIGLRSTKDTSKSYLFLVTAKHVVLDSNKKFIKEIYLRLNTKFGTAKEELIQLYFNKKPNILVNEDKTADIAVIPILTDLDRYDDYTGSKCTTYSGAKCTTHSG